MNSVLQDIRYGLRMLGKNPGFTAVAVLTLALGIGANTAIFTVLDAALTRSLPFEEPDRLVKVWMTKSGQFDQMEASYPNYLDWAEQHSVFTSLAGYSSRGGVLAGPEGPELLDTAVVSANFFETLGVQAALGRTFAAKEDKPEAARTLVLTHGFWQRRFGGDPDIIGRAVTFDDEPHNIIGVLPADFQFAPAASALMFHPPPREGSVVVRRNLHWFHVIGRLKAEASLEQAQAEMNAISAHLAQLHPDSNAGTDVRIVRLDEDVMGKVKPVLFILLGAVGFVLLIACVNVANLVLARSADRQREIGVRLALGAGVGRLVRQLLTESLLLAFLGGGAGLLVAVWGVDLLIAAIPGSVLSGMPYFQGLGVDPRALAFTFAVAMLTGILFGLVPALQLARLSMHETLKEAGMWSSGTRATHRLRDLLVVSQVALAAMLLIGAGLMIQSMVRMMQVDPGFDHRNLLTMRVVIPSSKYPEPAQRVAVEREVRERVLNLPSIIATASTTVLPLTGGSNTVRYRVEGRPEQSAGEQPEANTRSVTPDYFATLGATLHKGRYFNDQDHGDAPRVLIVNRVLAEQMFPGEEAVGKRLIFTFAPDQPAREIVGVVEEVKEVFLDAEPRPALYLPYAQNPGTFRSLVVRTAGPPEEMVAAVEKEIAAIDRDFIIFSVASMEQRVANAPPMFLRRYPALLSGVFAGLALLLAMIGVYGVLAYSVSQRTRELGVRVALGAQRRDLMALVMSKGMRLTLAGIAAGVGGAAVVSHLMRALLFGVRPLDAATFALIPLLILASTLLACYLPARRATRIDPMVALRHE